MMRTVSHVLWVLLAVLAAWLSAAPVRAASVSDAPPELFRVYFADWDDLARLASQLDVWEVNHDQGYLIAPLLAGETSTIGATHRVERAPSPAWPIVQVAQANAGGIPGFACYRTVAETYATLDHLVAAYPHLAREIDIGDSWDKVTPGGPTGHDLRVLVLTSYAYPGPKPRLFLMGAIHARELTTSETALRFAEQLLAGYGTDPKATWLLDFAELHVLAISNPDGRILAEDGQLWRKNTNTADACSFLFPPSVTYGVDLNRNYAFGWNSCPLDSSCSSGDSCSPTYRGEGPASEPETDAIQTYLRTIYADVRTGDGPAPSDVTGILISLHSYGQLVLYPWGMTTTPAPNAVGLATLAARFANLLGYRSCQAGAIGCLYPTDGTTDDWAYGELGIPAYTFELGTSFFETCETYEASIAPNALAALVYALQVAAVPYQQPQGPHMADLDLNPTTVAAGEPFTVTLRLEHPADVIRLSFGQPPWLPAALSHTYPAPPPDSSGLITLTVTHATDYLPAGRTLLFAQAQTTQAVAGPVVAQWITLTRASAFQVAVSPQSGAVYPGDEIHFRLTVTNTGALTATYVISSTAAWPIALAPITPTVVGPHAVAYADLSVVPPRGTAGEVAPAIVSVCASGPEPDCIQTTTVVMVIARRVLFPIIALNRAAPPSTVSP